MHWSTTRLLNLWREGRCRCLVPLGARRRQLSSTGFYCVFTAFPHLVRLQEVITGRTRPAAGAAASIGAEHFKMLGGAWSWPAAPAVVFLLVLAAILHKEDVRSAGASLPHRSTRGTVALQPERQHLVASHAAVSL